MRVAVLGRTQILYKAIQLIMDAGHEVVLIGTSKAAIEYTRTEEDFKKKSEELGIPFFCSSGINKQEIVDLIKTVNADLAISMNWPTIIGRSVIENFKYGILNAHPGDLPKYRGNACPNWAIINGEEEYVITIHFMTPGELDSGNILIKNRYELIEDISITEIYDTLEEEIPRMFLEAIEKIDSGEFEGTPQSKNNEDISRCYPRIPTDSLIDWNTTCNEISRIVRASCKPFEGAYTFYNGEKIHIMKCKSEKYNVKSYVIPGQVVSVDKRSGEVKVAAQDGMILFKEVCIAGKYIKASDVLKSTRIRLNYCTFREIYNLNKRIEVLEERIRRLEANIKD